MSSLKRVVGIAALVLIACALARAEEPTTKPSKPDKAPKAIKLVQPWSKLTTLTDDQKTQINDIHVRANTEVKTIRDKEEADIMALLTDAQKAELKKLDEDRRAEEKAKRAEKKADDKKDSGDPK